MALPVWPLPNKLQVSGFSQTLANNITSTNFDIGAPQVRQHSTGAPEIVQGVVILDELYGELTTFRTFYKDGLLSGSSRFTWYDPLDLSVTPTEVEMLFDPTQQPVINNNGGTIFTVSVKLLMFT